MSKHIGSNFDDFLEEEGIVINITLDDVISVIKEIKSLKDENRKLRSQIKHTEDLLDQALKELEVLQWQSHLKI